MSTAPEQLTAQFSGRVQGVGFRFHVLQIAKQFAVTGEVKNLVDGRVELVAQGEKAELARFLAEIQAQMDIFISQTETHWSPPTDSFKGFGIG